MAVRIRKDNRIFCAAMHEKKEGDIYINDKLHYEFSVNRKILVTDKDHLKHGEWWWKEHIPEGIIIDDFYLEDVV